MFAVIKTGGKQYRVAQDDVITVERLEGDAGSTLELAEVLMVGGGDAGTTIGAPLVEGARVAIEIVEHTRGDKVIAFKKRRRQNSRRKRGHRQDLTVLRVTGISLAGSGSEKKSARKSKPAESAAPAEGADATATA